MADSSYLSQLLTLPEVRGAYLSPDGKWIAFNWVRRHENQDVFVVPVDGSIPPLAMTHTPEATSFVNWLPDATGIIVEEDHDRDEFTRLFLVTLDSPGVMVPLTEDRPPFFLRGGSMLPDKQSIVYGANFDFDSESALEETCIYLHNLQTTNRVRLARPLKPGTRSVRLNQQGTRMLYDRKDRNPAGVQVHLLDLVSREDRELFNFGDGVKTFANWFPDGERILVLTESKDGGVQGYNSLGIYDLNTETLEWLVDDPNRNIESAYVAPDGTVIFIEVENAVLKSFMLDRHNLQPVPFNTAQGNLMVLGRAGAERWVGVYYASNHPRDLVTFAMHDGTVSDLVSLTGVWSLTELTPADLASAEPYSWQSTDDLTIRGWLYRAQPNSKRAVIYVHGGPTSHSEDAINVQIQSFVKQGFNVLDVNYRGSTGHGIAFRKAILVDGWGGREQDDIASGAKALIANGLAEPGRVGVTGTSYGGYSSWCQITHTPCEVIAASAPICGMTDLVIDYQTTRPDLRPYSAEMLGGTPDELPEKYYQRSPINFVNQITGKLLIIQGARDPNVTPENVEQVKKALDENHIPYETLVFADEGHGIGKPKNQLVLIQRLDEFFASSLG